MANLQRECPKSAPGFKTRAVQLCALLVLANLAAWLWALASFRGHPVLIGTSVLAYSLGLRHAVDADHIAAIDNASRKLMQAGGRPLGAGLYFSLGHSTVVVLATVGVALSASAFERGIAQIQSLFGVIGTLVSAFVLVAIAIMNLVIFAGLWRRVRDVRAGRGGLDTHASAMLASGGLLFRLTRPVFAMVGQSWHLYPIGLLFGLGFDTATEVSLLGISATGASRGLSIWSILVFPALFTAGMSLVDYLDGVFMVGAYGWALAQPLRRMYYNLAVTLLSIAVAVGVAGIEVLGLLEEPGERAGVFWRGVETLGNHSAGIGCVVIGGFGLAYALSVWIERTRRQSGA